MHVAYVYVCISAKQYSIIKMGVRTEKKRWYIYVHVQACNVILGGSFYNGGSSYIYICLHT